ncbi:MAG: ubiquinol-cytochrome C chaperone [Mesorhizobium sp.]|uniref:Ubiquinol-cytochrome C chaperone family protein n=1 Tax=Mesorhizobium abyssinicae TaxID=1209958 RepID=A0ABU5ASH2_9HYPH|nr:MULTISPECIES: ubiquinol-cytochrome C chaperone family protein [Mesorhizobium]MDX8540241.1 ubiquinol-cytochrome C chaperone family protein [Mesorhizobium abyssinicae]RWC96997.1 MAG: ubiquinol-cytochrome C chaperone [Mesorhizobium sp.]
MFQRFFGRERHANRAITEALYAQIVAAARQAVFYSDWNVPDTPLGRFEMLSLHMFLFQHRLRGESGAATEVAQVLIDEFFLDVEHSLRELGISDVGVPKRMKKLAKMFYGRTAAYDDALERDDKEALAAALTRNVVPDAGEWPQAPLLAAYVADAARHLAAQPAESIASGTLTFPAAG